MAIYIVFNCKKCGKEIEVLLAEVNRSKSKNFFCSRSCSQSYNQTKEKDKPLIELVICKNCGNSFYKRRTEIVKRPNNFCSCHCAAVYNNHKYPKRKRKGKTQNCLVCEKPLCRGQTRFCSFPCFFKNKRETYLARWKAGLEKGYVGKQKAVSKTIRYYLFEINNNKCSKCGWATIHEKTGLIPLTVNHIDGDIENCKENNLELLCPNCHSLTPNYGRLNKISKRDRGTRRKRKLIKIIGTGNSMAESDSSKVGVASSILVPCSKRKKAIKIELICAFCEKPFYTPKRVYKAKIHIGQKRFFCCRKHQIVVQQKERSDRLKKEKLLLGSSMVEQTAVEAQPFKET